MMNWSVRHPFEGLFCAAQDFAGLLNRYIKFLSQFRIHDRLTLRNAGVAQEAEHIVVL